MSTVIKTAQNKILTHEELKKNILPADKKIVLAGGCFDIFHYGHLTFLLGAKKAGDILVVALESDEFIEVRKKRKPVHTQVQRAQILAHLDMVDFVILLPHLETYTEYLELVTTVKPAIIAVTQGDSKQSEKERQAAIIGAQLEVVCPLVDEQSTTKIIDYANIFSD